MGLKQRSADRFVDGSSRRRRRRLPLSYRVPFLSCVQQ